MNKMNLLDLGYLAFLESQCDRIDAGWGDELTKNRLIDAIRARIALLPKKHTPPLALERLCERLQIPEWRLLIGKNT